MANLSINLNNTELFKNAFVKALRYMYENKYLSAFAKESLIRAPFYCLALTESTRYKDILNELKYVGRGLHSGYERALEDRANYYTDARKQWCDYMSEYRKSANFRKFSRLEYLT